MIIMVVIFYYLYEDLLFSLLVDDYVYWKYENGKIICYIGEKLGIILINIVFVYIIIRVGWYIGYWLVVNYK